MTLRANIYEQFPFKDVKGGWNVVVNLGETTCRFLFLNLYFIYYLFEFNKIKILTQSIIVSHILRKNKAMDQMKTILNSNGY